MKVMETVERRSRKCDVYGCSGPAIYILEDQELGDCDHHDCIEHIIIEADRHEAIAYRLRSVVNYLVNK